MTDVMKETVHCICTRFRFIFATLRPGFSAKMYCISETAVLNLKYVLVVGAHYLWKKSKYTLDILRVLAKFLQR
jgi:hypothetical protein